jgi:hypothetical protein
MSRKRLVMSARSSRRPSWRKFQPSSRVSVASVMPSKSIEEEMIFS